MIVETNWILDIALGQSDASLTLLEMAERSEVAVYLPAVCTTEAIKAFENRRGRWRELSDRLESEAREFERSTNLAEVRRDVLGTAAALVQIGDTLERRLWSALERAMRIAIPLVFDVDALIGAKELRDALALSPADAAVLATVVRSKECRSFVSRDRRAFDTSDCRRLFRDERLLFYSDPAHFIARHLNRT